MVRVAGADSQSVLVSGLLNIFVQFKSPAWPIRRNLKYLACALLTSCSAVILVIADIASSESS